jgi:microcompartment protein CcmL/EutN
MKYSCVGFLELSTIAKGIQVVDALLKKATVHLIFAYPVSSGKYLVSFEGEVEEVRSALAAGQEVAEVALLDSFLLPNIHPQIIPALQKRVVVDSLEAIGILETVTCATCVVASDAALKTSKVRLIKIQLARGIGGKAYFIIEGEVGEVEAAIVAAIRAIQKKGIIEKVVIPHATPKLLQLFE